MISAARRDHGAGQQGRDCGATPLPACLRPVTDHGGPTSPRPRDRLPRLRALLITWSRHRPGPVTKYLRAWIVLLLALLLAGCAAPGRQVWYKPGGTQREFDIDARECEVIARQQAIAAGERGRRYAPEVYAGRFEQCLGRMGWSRTPPGPQPSPGGEDHVVSPLARLAEGGLALFGSRVHLPTGSRLVRHDRRRSGPAREEAFFFRLDDGAYLNLIVQQGGETIFVRQDYPVPPPYHLYASGRRPSIRWAALWARLPGGQWVKAIGAYVFFSDTQRLTVVLTAPLSPPATAPPAGLTLAANQHQELGAFVDTWRPWLASLPPPPSLGHRLLQALGRSVRRF